MICYVIEHINIFQRDHVSICHICLEDKHAKAQPGSAITADGLCGERLDFGIFLIPQARLDKDMLS